MDQAVPEPEVQKDRAKLGDWMNNHPNSLYTLSETVAILFNEEKWGEAIPHLEHWISLNSTQHDENNNAYRLLAQAYRKLNDPEKERQALLEVVRFDGSAVDAFRRLFGTGILTLKTGHSWRNTPVQRLIHYWPILISFWVGRQRLLVKVLRLFKHTKISCTLSRPTQLMFTIVWDDCWRILIPMLPAGIYFRL